jgi:hypothetical protein
MMHGHRRFCVNPVASAEELARMLTERTWTLCSGFFVQGHENYLFLNDSTHEDGAGEYAVILGGLDAEHRMQIESVTMSWCPVDQGLAYIRNALSGEWDANDFRKPVVLHLETPLQHGRCLHCE